MSGKQQESVFLTTSVDPTGKTELDDGPYLS